MMMMMMIDGRQGVKERRRQAQADEAGNEEGGNVCEM
jgi:hypothetical protein